eukprot:CAMPEP_0183295884 /NCGR_PEP_ID=MMETSP0160_2-20130417/3669_1 /TAXON_ID=2839 ORGANISM="Odontella Sinensis, Strain Grunow 1884" /NCGR_SAMPLE_ID=MMETSP0160_2 /ASSEMBLY_ACC=CAM_ASM_000250 /LENGTH=311 /DNA_ID=CAMNT_0025457423 /DNA_START=30 /DNA_END=962 /DNA_ORIENTATION=+
MAVLAHAQRHRGPPEMRELFTVILSALLLLCPVALSFSTDSPPRSQPPPASSIPDLSLSSSPPTHRSTIFPGSAPVDTKDLATLVLQTGQRGPASAAIGRPACCTCRHGFAQAYAMDPLPASTGRANSGLLKLTCPHLVRAVDALEDEGGIDALNERVNISPLPGEEKGLNGDGKWLREAVSEAHQVHARVRREMLSSDEDVAFLQNKLGEEGSLFFLDSGVAGATGSQPPSNSAIDVKCLHAWLADMLFRKAGASAVGEEVAWELQQRGVDLTGTPTCRSACDPDWDGDRPNPPAPRNRQRLRSGKEVAR